MADFEDDEELDEPESFDAIEREVAVRAPLEAVWAVVSVPGWWVNDGAIVDHDIEEDAGLYRVDDPASGVYLVDIVGLDEPEFAAFRWYPLEADEFPDERVTDVEISLAEGSDGTTRVHVAESGLSHVSDDPEVARQAWEDEGGGWDEQLAALRARLEG